MSHTAVVPGTSSVVGSLATRSSSANSVAPGDSGGAVVWGDIVADAEAVAVGSSVGGRVSGGGVPGDSLGCVPQAPTSMPVRIAAATSVLIIRRPPTGCCQQAPGDKDAARDVQAEAWVRP